MMEQRKKRSNNGREKRIEKRTDMASRPHKEKSKILIEPHTFTEDPKKKRRVIEKKKKEGKWACARTYGGGNGTTSYSGGILR